jgi:hypothetical protein
MAYIAGNRVQETTTSTGTGPVSLGGAVSKYRAVSAICADGDTVNYAIEHTSAAEWEVGIGTYNASGNTLARTTVLQSSNANALVNFSAGTKNVSNVMLAEFVNTNTGLQICMSLGIFTP